MAVRVRYAPSPTGLQHIGGLRTALFNYFFARSQGGSFILRIEDTDQTRYTPEALQDIYDTFAWVGIQEDEGPRTGGDRGPYIQSQRLDLYQRYARELVENGQAYPCFCTPERLEKVREQQVKDKASVQGYDRACRDLTPRQVQEKMNEGLKPVIRLKVPLDGETSFHDQLLGTVVRKNQDVNPDPIILKSDGYPTYHLANVVDDHLMGITHILRAQEWIPSGPLHVLLYHAFGWEPPQYIHLPMVMGQDGQKLSKRHGSTSVIEFRNAGYLPEAIVNYVSLLGWSYDGEREFFDRSDLERLFDPAKLQKSPAVFDYKKLQWFNGQYMRKLPQDDLYRGVMPYLQKEGLVDTRESQSTILKAALPLIQERINLLSDVVDTAGFLFKDDLDYDPALLIPKGLSSGETAQVLEKVLDIIPKLYSVSAEEGEQVFHSLVETLGKKMGQVMMPVRIAVTGTKGSPPLVASIQILPQQIVEKRIQLAIELVNKMGD